MILYPLIVTLAQAGGPSATKSVAVEDKVKRQTPIITEYVAVATFPNPNPSNGYGKHYCLRNMGISVTALEECTQISLTDATSLFTFEPAFGYTLGEGYYVMKSAYDNLCNFNFYY